MATITFNEQRTGFAMWQAELTGQIIGRGRDFLDLKTAGGHAAVLGGKSFSYDSVGTPNGGFVDNLFINYGGYKSEGTPSITMTGLDLGLTDFLHVYGNGTPTERTMAFWQTALSGNDTIEFGSGATAKGFNISFAGDGHEAYHDRSANDVMRGDVGGGSIASDYFSVGAGKTVFGGNDVVELTGSYNAQVVGDVAYTGANAKVFGGHDVIRLGSGSIAVGDVSTLNGILVGGNDTIWGSSEADSIVGDVLSAPQGSTFQGGDDELHGGGGDDVIYGDSGSTGSLASRGGNDRLYGDDGNDYLAGKGGDDLLFGGSGDDTVNGGDGNDVLQGNAGYDKLSGGSDVDTADYSDRSKSVVLTLDVNGSAVAKVNGVVEDELESIENIIGGSAGDKIAGYKDQNDNRFEGRGGNDTLIGGAGKDTLVGGKGNDKLNGGVESDQFVFNTKLGSGNIDRIVDFVHGNDDIVLDDAIFAALGTTFERNEFAALADGHAATKKAQHILYDKSDGTLWYDVDGRGGKAAVQFAQLGTEKSHPTNLTWDDFSIV